MDSKKVLSIEIISFGLIFLLALTVFREEYLFGWLTHNWTFYLSLCAIALVMIGWKKPNLSLWVSAGIVVGVFIGNFLGKWIEQNNISKITKNMDAQQIAMLRRNPGFFIWIGIIVLAFGIGLFIQIKTKRKENKA